MFLLDTNVCIQFLNGRSPKVRARLESLTPAEVRLSAVVKAELLYGAAKSRIRATVERELEQFFEPFASLPFDDDAAASYGTIRATLEMQGALIGPNDLLIAATAVAHDATLVTHNIREFGRVPGLKCEDWE